MMVQNYLCNVSHFLDSRSILFSENANEGEDSVSWGQSPRSQPLLPAMPTIIFFVVGVMDSYEIFRFLTKLLNGGKPQDLQYSLSFFLLKIKPQNLDLFRHMLF